ncbi:MAG: response regulator [Sulfuricella sp.]|nr:response regulator [Sulfuricella sp.]
MNGLTVLYVEDEEILRKLLTSLLAKRVGRLVTARDGREGLQTFIACRPDVVLTDICMPVMDGLEMATHVRNLRPAVPIAFLTGSAERLGEFERFNPSLDEVLTKPVNFSALMRLLERYAADSAEGAPVGAPVAPGRPLEMNSP